MINIPEYIQTAITTLEAFGYSAYIVGGCIRDSLLGLTPGDWDIASSATPEELMECFKGHKLILTGLKHGTVTVVISDHPVEITTFRLDGEYLDSRHPSRVDYSRNIFEDLRRRDFTVNAMAYSQSTGLVDPYGGQKDLKKRLLRCVGSPEERFSEDALRILRCLRFSAQLDFEIEAASSAAANSCRHLIKHISPERIQIELSKTLCHRSSSRVLRENSEIIFTVLPELAPMKNCSQENPFHIYDVWEHSLHAIDCSPELPDVRMALLFHDSGKPEVKTVDSNGTAHFYDHPVISTEYAASALERLRFPKSFLKDVVWLVRHHDQPLPLKTIKIKRYLGDQGPELFFKLLDVMAADISAQAAFVFEERMSNLELTKSEAQKLLDTGRCLRLSDLAIDGQDLLSLGFPENQLIGDTLKELLDLVLHDQIPNDKQRLLLIAKRRREKLAKKIDKAYNLDKSSEQKP